jgi:Phage integrase family
VGRLISLALTQSVGCSPPSADSSAFAFNSRCFILISSNLISRPPGQRAAVGRRPTPGKSRSRVRGLRAVDAAGLAPLRFHDLRHTAAALAIWVGAHPKAIQERLGHASITTTLDRYGHLFRALDAAFAERLGEMAAAGPARDTSGTVTFQESGR